MKTKEQKEAKKLRIKQQMKNKHLMEICRTSCSLLALLLNLWVVCHVYLK